MLGPERRTNVIHHEDGIITYTVHTPRNQYFPTGWGNGYIALPEGHPKYGIPYDNAECVWDQGWTFSGKRIVEDKDGELKTYWVLGFDTSHWGDSMRTWPESRVVKCITTCVDLFTTKKIGHENNS